MAPGHPYLHLMDLTASMHGTETNKIIQIKFEPSRQDFQGVRTCIFHRFFKWTAICSEPTQQPQTDVCLEKRYAKMDGPLQEILKS